MDEELRKETVVVDQGLLFRIREIAIKVVATEPVPSWGRDNLQVYSLMMATLQALQERGLAIEIKEPNLLA